VDQPAGTGTAKAGVIATWKNVRRWEIGRTCSAVSTGSSFGLWERQRFLEAFNNAAYYKIRFLPTQTNAGGRALVGLFYSQIIW